MNGDDRSWEEEEDEEDEEEDVEFSEESDDKLGTTNKESHIRKRLEEEERDEEDEETEEEEEEEEELYGQLEQQAFIPGTRVKLAPENNVRCAVGCHWHAVMGLCCGKVGMVQRGHGDEGNSTSKVFVTFAFPESTTPSALSTASFTLPAGVLLYADRRRSRANTSVISNTTSPPQPSILAATTASPRRKNSR
eukprot:TRINITY_DN2249_c10_g1_i1.p1 TRINITY_DN2249_c10_g1~~TRINITY_DN2249_c10_g1_i1.p1  ORF type:complete len:193 (+),score=46.52 TRINITY_DN2249_c10_g1_i1:229-807(+)